MAMSRAAYESFGQRAVQGRGFAEIAGRYWFQATQEKYITEDVSAKLDLGVKDDLLEIGCGAGNLLLVLAGLVRSAAGIDHPNLMALLAERDQACKVSRFPGNFLDTHLKDTFSKVLIYSVVQYLASVDEVTRVVDKALSLLRPGGRLLVGDLPNVDKRRRFANSQTGKNFQVEWDQRVQSEATGERANLPISDDKMVCITDEVVCRLLRQARLEGCDSYLLPQPTTLPFCFTREDILILRPE
jgi:SAM-dependent methyltransferase